MNVFEERMFAMAEKILVAYASTHGSTQEIAEAVAKALQECGFVVDLRVARSVSSLEGYSAVVLGAPIYMFRLHKDAVRFLSRHGQTLAEGLPAAIFAGGPFGTNAEKDWQEVRTKLDQELAKIDWFKPAAIEVVGGKFDPLKLRFPWNLIPALKQMPASDLRDWEAIHAWACGLAERFSHLQKERIVVERV
jgi:menaquinone-dependent protoporphyrinogen oxidase